MFYNYITFIVGIVIIIITLFLIKKDLYNNPNTNKVYYDKDNELLKNIEVADDIINELNEISDNIINRLDIKISEVNKLLQQAEKIASESNDRTNLCTEIQEVTTTKTMDIKEDNKNELKNEKTIDNSNNEIKRILELKENGHSSSEIAKMLNKGIGEVSLIMNLNKR